MLAEGREEDPAEVGRQALPTRGLRRVQGQRIVPLEAEEQAELRTGEEVERSEKCL